MASPSPVNICNRALQELGAKRITSLTENSRNAIACNEAYDVIRQATLREHRWNFAKARIQLAADSAAPVFGRARAFTLPTDCLRVLEPYPEDDLNDRDWEVEDGAIYTDWDAPLNIRYITDVTNVQKMDPCYREYLSARLALALCELITQSNQKKIHAVNWEKEAFAKAKKANAFEIVSQKPVDDTFVTVRS